MSNTKPPKPKALIIDDDIHICHFIKTYSDSLDFETTVLSQPEKLCDVYRQEFDLFVVDLNMPKVDGIEIIRFLGLNKSKAQVILISAEEQSILLAARELANSHNLSVLGIVNKPIKSDVLTNLLSKGMDRIRALEISAELVNPLMPEGSMELPSLEELKTAITDGEIDVYFQPKIFLADGSMAGVEALARWKHPDKGFIPPDFFIAFAEEYNLIEQLTEHILVKTCNYASEWNGLPDDFRISVNVSTLSLGDLYFPDILARTIKENRMKPSQFVLEITESTFSEDPTATLDVLTRLKLRGFSLSIDDFGTGHSSLARLRQIPFSELKIDKSFVIASDTNSECRIIIKNTIELANNLGLKVVAEGAETKEHIKLLTGYECDIVQGFFYAKPMPSEQFTEWYLNWEETQSSAGQ